MHAPMLDITQSEGTLRRSALSSFLINPSLNLRSFAALGVFLPMPFWSKQGNLASIVGLSLSLTFYTSSLGIPIQLRDNSALQTGLVRVLH